MLTRCASVLCFLTAAIATVVAGERAPGPRYGGTLRIAVDGVILAVDPFKGTRFRQHFGFTRLYAEGLVDLDKQANLVPGVAESWEITPDGRVYTFKLRKGVKFHHGDELTAEDVKWSFEYAMDRKSAAFYRTNLDAVEAIEIGDRYTIRMKLKRASAPFLSNIYALFIPVLSRKTLPALDSAPIGTGPFAVDEWKPGVHLKLRRFKEYWKQGRPYVDEVVFRFVPDESIRYTALRSGDVDIADELPPQMMADLKGAPQKGFRVLAIPGGGYMILVMNIRKGPLSDVRVRQAVAFALDKEEILRATRWGEGEATNQLFTKSSPWHFDVEDRKRDLATARRLLAEAGFAQGFTIPMVLSTKYLSTGQLLQSQLRRIGIQVDFEQVDDPTRLTRQTKADFITTLTGLGYPVDPDHYAIYFYTKAGVRNRTGYSDPEYDRQYERAIVEQDFSKRKVLYTEMMRILQRDVPEIVLWSSHRYFGWRDHVKGFVPSVAAVTLYHGGGLETTWMDQ
jgi:peptide/nickel transport system substrate-binding protein